MYKKTDDPFARKSHAATENDTFWWGFGLLLVGLMIIYDQCATYGSSAAETAGTEVSHYYLFFSHICIMIFIGFGYLMAFLRKAGYTAVGLTFCCSSFCILFGMLVIGFFNNASEVDNGGEWHKIPVGVELMLQGLFAAATVMITFGAVIGKVTPIQLLVIAFFEVLFYGLNYYLLYKRLLVVDVGGALVIHLFGAYFGVALSLVICRKPNTAFRHPCNSARTDSDMLAMIGTIFLWICWPSFNAVAVLQGARQRALLNTFVSLCSSCLFCFITSRLLGKHKKFDMVHIQNASLAGGVAMGAMADHYISIGGAMGTGAIAGILSTWGFEKLQPYLYFKLKLDDTCGVHNLHGLPALLGGFASVISTAKQTEEDYGLPFSSFFSAGRDNVSQPLYQLASIATALGLALASGALTGYIIKYTTTNPERVVEDEPFFVVCDDYTRYIDPSSKTNRFAQQQSSMAMSLSDLKTILGEVDSEEVMQNTQINKMLSGVAPFETSNDNVRSNINSNNGVTSPASPTTTTAIDRRLSGPTSILKKPTMDLESIEQVSDTNNGTGDAPASTSVDTPVETPKEATRSVTIMVE